MNRTEKQVQFTDYATARLPWLRQVAYLLCQDWHRADDLVQTSITKLYLNWHRIREDGSPDGYARAILVNTFIAEQRSPWWKRVALHQDRGDASPAEPDGPLGRIAAPAGPDLDAGLDLRRALALLPARQRATIVLRYYCELSVAETARELGCSPGTVKSQTSRALDTLRASMGLPDAAAGAAAAPPPAAANRPPAARTQKTTLTRTGLPMERTIR